METDDTLLPGSRFCVGCSHITFRKRNDGLCPKCAWQAEQLIEQIELDSLEQDLATITRFEAYCHQRLTGDAVLRPTAGQSFKGPWPDRRPA